MFVPQGAPADPFSFINLTVTLVGTPVGTTGELSVTGGADVFTDISADPPNKWEAGPGDGEFAFNTSTFLVEDISDVLIDLDTLGTLLLDLVGVGIAIESSGDAIGGAAIPVDGNEWNLDSIGAPDVMNMTLSQGSIVLHDPVGAIADFLDDPTVINLNTDPVGVAIDDLLGLNIGGTADSRSASTLIPNIAVDVGEDVIGAGFIFAELEGDLFVSVPEPGGIALLGLGLVGLMAIRRRRYRSAA